MRVSRRPVLRRPRPAELRLISRAAVAAAVLAGVVPLTASMSHVTRRPSAHPGPAVPSPTLVLPSLESTAPRVSRDRRPALPTGANDPALVRLATATDIPPRALFAYRAAATAQHRRDRSCHLQWEFIAAFGRMETNHGRLGGSSIGVDGVARPAILGPVLDGSQPGVIGHLADDSGAAVRAAGPLQFIPDTWKRWGRGDIHDIDNAASGAARYLCADGRDLSTTAGRRAAALAYNNVAWYAADVLAVYADYLHRRPAHSFPVKPGAGMPAPGISAKAGVAARRNAVAPAPAPTPSIAPAAARPTPALVPTRTTSAATTAPHSPSPVKSPTPSVTTSP